MIQRSPAIIGEAASGSFANAMRRLGETFTVRDVMVPLSAIEYVAPGEQMSAQSLAEEKAFSVIPISLDGEAFQNVYETRRHGTGRRVITGEKQTSISDFIPDSTPLAEAVFLFGEREWYLTLRGN
jgi:hypothetical protein